MCEPVAHLETSNALTVSWFSKQRRTFRGFPSRHWWASRPSPEFTEGFCTGPPPPPEGGRVGKVLNPTENSRLISHPNVSFLVSRNLFTFKQLVFRQFPLVSSKFKKICQSSFFFNFYYYKQTNSYSTDITAVKCHKASDPASPRRLKTSDKRNERLVLHFIRPRPPAVGKRACEAVLLWSNSPVRLVDVFRCFLDEAPGRNEVERYVRECMCLPSPWEWTQSTPRGVWRELHGDSAAEQLCHLVAIWRQFSSPIRRLFTKETGSGCSVRTCIFVVTEWNLVQMHIGTTTQLKVKSICWKANGHWKSRSTLADRSGTDHKCTTNIKHRSSDKTWISKGT